MMSGGDSTSRKRRQGGPGRPWKPGERPPGAAPLWQPGQSGNPGGKPSQAGFRERCRQVAASLLELIATGTATHDQVRAFEAVADRGGFVAADKWAVVAAALGRLLAGEGLTAEERAQLVQDCRKTLALEAAEAKPNGEP